jgi:hypothetical protein
LSMETAAHAQLKRLAISFLRQRGCHAVATEVRCPIFRYRVDVAGYQDTLPWDAGGRGSASHKLVQPRTFIIECKQSRSDFMRDCEHTTELLEVRSQLHSIRQSIEHNRIKRLEPQLQCGGTSLFAELEDWDFSASRLPAYREVLRKLRRIDQKLHGGTKFFLIDHYALADELYVATPAGLIRRNELPAGWGLLECDARSIAPLSSIAPDGSRCMNVAVASRVRAAKPPYRQRLLRNIAVSLSWRMHEGTGADPREFAVGDG